MATNPINFFQPGTDGAADMQQIQRQRDMAALLMKQSQTPVQGQMVSGHYVAPSWISGLANALKAGAGSYLGTKADKDEKTAINAQRDRNAADLDAFVSAQSGTPAVPGRTIAPLTPNDDEGNPMPAATVEPQAAVAPDRAKALAIALRSQNPMLQSMGGKLFEQQMADQQMRSEMQALGITPPGAPGAAPAGAAAADAGAAGPAPAGAPSAGGVLAGMDPRALGLMLSRSPQLQKVGAAAMEQGKPIALREGDLVVPDGQGGFRSAYTQPKLEAGMQPVRDARGGLLGASAIPGYAPGIAQIQGAKAQATQGAESQNTMVTVKGPDGRDYQMTRQQALQMANGGAPAQAPVNNSVGAGYAGGSAAAAAGGQAEILSSELGKAQQEFAAAQQRGDAAAASRAQSDIAGIQRELGRLPGAARPAAPVAPVMPGIPGQSPAQAADQDAERARKIDTAKADVVRNTGQIGDIKKAGQMREAADSAMKLLNAGPTGSGAGALTDNVLNFVGQPTASGTAAQQLEAIGGALMANVPRMEGPQSDADVRNYKLMAGNVGDRTLPVEARKAALRTVIEIQDKYAALNGGTAPPAPAAAPAAGGLPAGWTVKVR